MRKIAAPGVRNIATIGGNIINASPAGDTLPALYVMDAELLLKSSDGEKIYPVEEFITGPGKTKIEKGFLLTHIILKQENFDYEKFVKIGSRNAQTLSKASAAVVYKKGESIRFAFGAVGPTVVRNRKLEKKIFEKLDDITFEEFCKVYGEIITPITDQRSTAEYRKAIALNIGYSLLIEARNK
jgi:CO/xanthine dehydrogenase FAD-binding subunit